MNPFIRAARTYLQVLIGLLIAGWADVTDAASALSLGQAALLASIPAALSLLQNALEDSTEVQILPKG
jgi:hypothetical protein